MTDVTITLSHDDLATVRYGLRCAYVGLHSESVTRTQIHAIETALDAAAAPRPAEEADTLDAAIAECEAKGWEWRIDGTWQPDGPDSLRFERAGGIRLPSNQDDNEWIGVADYSEQSPIVLLRAAMTVAEEW